MKQSFKDFLIGPITKESAVSYVSYAENAFKKMMQTDESIFSYLEPFKHTSRVRFCENLVALLNDAIEDPASEYNPKTLKNYKSAVSKLGVFFEQRIYRKQGTKTFTKAIISAYRYDELLDNFLFRMETQDRVYPKKHCCFPCRLFKMIYGKNSTYNKMMKDTVDATTFVTNAGHFSLSQVDKLQINKGHSAILIHDAAYDVYTEVYKKGVSYGFQKATAKTLPELSLDHDKPMVELVVENIDNLPELKRLCDAFLTFKAACGLAGSKLTTQFYKTIYPALKVDEDQMLKDIAVIFKDIHLTVMETKYNSSKNKNTPKTKVP